MRFKLLLGLLLGSLMISLSGCRWREHGERSQGIYLAPKSGYQLELIFVGAWDPDAETMQENFRLVQICPLKPNQGRPVRFTLHRPRTRGVSFFQQEGAPPPPQTQEHEFTSQMFRKILSENGFGAIDKETNQMEIILSTGYAQDGSSIPKDYLNAITVVKQNYESDYNYKKIDLSKPRSEWVESSELLPCKISQ